MQPVARASPSRAPDPAPGQISALKTPEGDTQVDSDPASLKCAINIQAGGVHDVEHDGEAVGDQDRLVGQTG